MIFLTDEEGESSFGPYQGHVEMHAILMAVVTNDSAIVFSLVSIYDCIAPGNLSVQSTSAQRRPILMSYVLKLMPGRFSP